MINFITGKWIVPKYGALTTLKWNCVCMIFWTLMQELSWFVNRWEPLLVGRLLLSIHLGVVLLGVPMYINEVAPKWCKGALSVLHPMAINVGSLTSSIFGIKVVLGTVANWHWMLLISCITMFTQFFVSMFWLPESAYVFFTNRKNPTAAAKSADFYLNKSEDKTEQLKPLQDAAASSSGSKKHALHLWDALRRPDLRIPMLLAAAVAVANVSTGQLIVRSYSTHMFAAAGLGQSLSSYATIVLFAESTVVSLMATYLTERIGRQRLLIFSIFAIAGLFTCIFVVSLTAEYMPQAVDTNSTIFSNSSLLDIVANQTLRKTRISKPKIGSQAIAARTPQWAAYGIAALILLWPVFYNIGIGNLQHFVIVEVFPTNLRSVGQAFNIQLVYTLGIFNNFAYLPLQESIGAWTYILLCVAPLIGSGLVIWKFFPSHPNSKPISDNPVVEAKARNKIVPEQKV